MRTSFALDTGNLSNLKPLAERWSVLKAEVMRRATCKAQKDAAFAVLDRQGTDSTSRDAEEAARLFNLSGRRRGSHADCMIASAAIVSGVPLATLNGADFQRLVPFGLVLEG